jgi:hypothetical protein
MAIKTRIATQAGSDGSPTLAVTAWDTGKATTSVTDLMNAAIAAAPTDIFGIPLGGVTSIDQRSNWLCHFTLTYKTAPIGAAASVPADPAEGTAVRRFPGAQAKAKKAKHFITAGKVYWFDGTTTQDVTSDFPNTKWQINAHETSWGNFPPQETTFEPHAESWSVEFIVANANVDYDYIAAVSRAATRGVFNSTTFDGQDAGTVQLVRFSALPKSGEAWEYVYGFADVPEEENVNVAGGIVVPSILGSEEYWVRDFKEFDEVGNVVESRTDICVVGQVWEEEDLATLLDLPTLP